MSHKRLAVMSVLIISIFLFVIQNQDPITFTWLLFKFPPLAAFWWVILLVALGFALGFATAYYYLVRPLGKEPADKPAGKASSGDSARL